MSISSCHMALDRSTRKHFKECMCVCLPSVPGSFNMITVNNGSSCVLSSNQPPTKTRPCDDVLRVSLLWFVRSSWLADQGDWSGSLNLTFQRERIKRYLNIKSSPLHSPLILGAVKRSPALIKEVCGVHTQYFSLVAWLPVLACAEMIYACFTRWKVSSFCLMSTVG